MDASREDVAATAEKSSGGGSRDRPRGLRRWLILFAIGVAVALVAVSFALAPRRIATWLADPEGRPQVRGASIAALDVLRIAHVMAWSILPAGLAVLVVICARRGKRRVAAGLPARLALLTGSLLVGLLGAEFLGAHWLRELRRPHRFPTKFEEMRDPGAITIAVVGESSALGTPYDPWLSVGQIVAWRLTEATGRPVDLELFAAGGICLEQAIKLFESTKKRPDLVIVYAGHNEFQARFGWRRDVRYYEDEEPRALPSRLEKWWRAVSPLASLIVDARDLQMIDEPPPSKARREVVDHPAFRPDEFDFLLADFERRLDDLLAYTRRIGVVAVVIAPCGNLVDFPPYRSVLAASAGAAERARFAQEFEAARLLESSDPDSAAARYEALVREYPEFADLHYRIGRLALARGAFDQARTALERARDRDGMPMRCPGPFLEAMRRAAGRRGALFVDAGEVIRRLTPEGMLDKRVFHDPQHPTLYGYTAVAAEVLRGLEARGYSAPRRGGVETTGLIDDLYEQTVEHFGMTPERWAEVCHKTAILFTRLSSLGREPMECLAQADRLLRARDAILTGTPPEQCGIPGIGARPATSAGLQSDAVN